jgi:DNA-binding HxlR family transcriptional regulator
MLTLTLKGLERDGLVTRTVYPTIPLRVEYKLTDLGRTLRKPIQALAKWAQENRERIQQARNRYDSNSPPRVLQRLKP